MHNSRGCTQASAAAAACDKALRPVRRWMKLRLIAVMEQDWTKVDFRDLTAPKGVDGDRLRLAQEALARDLAINLSAFMRVSVAASYAGTGESVYREFLKDEERSCFTVVLLRPNEHRLLVQIESAILFPLIGIALGAKIGSFTSPERKPTDIELQVVGMIVRMVLSEAYRAWAPLLNTQLETVALEVEQTPARVFPAHETVHASRFNLTLGEHCGALIFAAPVNLFAPALAGPSNVPERSTEAGGYAEAALELMMQAKIDVDVWLDGSEIRLSDLLQLREGQIVKLDHPVERKVLCKLNGKGGFSGQMVSTGAHRAFLVEEEAR